MIELVEVSPQRQAASLKDILRIGIVRQQCADVREDPSLIPQKMLQKLLVASVFACVFRGFVCHDQLGRSTRSSGSDFHLSQEMVRTILDLLKKTFGALAFRRQMAVW